MCCLSPYVDGGALSCLLGKTLHLFRVGDLRLSAALLRIIKYVDLDVRKKEYI